MHSTGISSTLRWSRPSLLPPNTGIDSGPQAYADANTSITHAGTAFSRIGRGESKVRGPEKQRQPRRGESELLNFILSRPEFTTAGISTDSCVWATYTDGVELIVVNNREPDLPASSTPASSSEVAQSRLASPQPESLPQSREGPPVLYPRPVVPAIQFPISATG